MAKAEKPASTRITPLTTEERAKAIKLIKKDMSDREVAAIIGVSRSSVLRLRREENLPVFVRTEKVRQKIMKMFSDRKSYQEICHAVKLSKREVRRLMGRMGILERFEWYTTKLAELKENDSSNGASPP